MSIREHLTYDSTNDLIIGVEDHGEKGRSNELVTYVLVFMICGFKKMEATHQSGTPWLDSTAAVAARDTVSNALDTSSCTPTSRLCFPRRITSLRVLQLFKQSFPGRNPR